MPTNQLDCTKDGIINRRRRRRPPPPAAPRRRITRILRESARYALGACILSFRPGSEFAPVRAPARAQSGPNSLVTSRALPHPTRAPRREGHAHRDPRHAHARSLARTHTNTSTRACTHEHNNKQMRCTPAQPYTAHAPYIPPPCLPPAPPAPLITCTPPFFLTNHFALHQAPVPVTVIVVLLCAARVHGPGLEGSVCERCYGVPRTHRDGRR